MRSRIVEFSKFADLGIEDIEKSDNHILSRHLQYDTNGVAKGETSFPFLSMDSEGTIKYFSMAYPIIRLLTTDRDLSLMSSTPNCIRF